MESVKVKIKGSIVTNRYGALSDGDIVASDEAYAKHLVDMGAAEYVSGAPQADQETREAGAQESEPELNLGRRETDHAESEEAPEGARPVPQPKSPRRRAE